MNRASVLPKFSLRNDSASFELQFVCTIISVINLNYVKYPTNIRLCSQANQNHLLREMETDSSLIAGSIRPKFPDGTESFRKFVSKSSVNLSRVPLFLEIWKFQKFPVPFGISIRYDLGLSSPSREFCLDQSYTMATNRHYTGRKMICHR